MVERTCLEMRPGIKNPDEILEIWQTEPGHSVKYLQIDELLAKQLQGQDLYNEDVILVQDRRILFPKKSRYTVTGSMNKH